MRIGEMKETTLLFWEWENKIKFMNERALNLKLIELI